MVTYFPLFVDLADRRCLVVGGGSVGERKVVALLAAGARVTIVSPRLTPTLTRLVSAGCARHLRRRYRSADLAGVALAFTTTGDGRVDRAVATDGRRRRVWVNAADDPSHCDFILPSVLRRGVLTVAVSTGGASPAVARAVRQELEQTITDAHGALVELASQVRRTLRARGRSVEPERWQRALRGARRLLATGRRNEARTWLARRLGAAS
jgi:siroheme synthase-like protein